MASSSNTTTTTEAAATGGKTTLKALLQRVPRNTDVSKIASIFAQDGAIIIEGFLTPEQIQRFNAELDDPLQKLLPGGEMEGVPDETRGFLGLKTKRLTDLITHSKTWREEIVNDDLMHAICEEILTKHVGGYWLSTAQMMEIGPGNPKQPLHRDFGNWWPNYVMPPSTPETLLNFLLATTDTTEENGATRAIPGSHKWPYSVDDHNFGGEDQALTCPLKAGDVLLIGGRIVHGGGENSTKDFYRRVLSIAICANCYAQEEAFALTVELETVKKLPIRVQRFLGFRSQYPMGSPGIWTANAKEIGRHIGLEPMEEVASKVLFFGDGA